MGGGVDSSRLSVAVKPDGVTLLADGRVWLAFTDTAAMISVARNVLGQSRRFSNQTWIDIAEFVRDYVGESQWIMAALAEL